MFLLYYCSIVMIIVRTDKNANTKLSTGVIYTRSRQGQKLRIVKTEGCVGEEHPRADQKQSFEPDSSQHAIQSANSYTMEPSHEQTLLNERTVYCHGSEKFRQDLLLLTG